jgi:amino acid transporter
VRGILGRWSLLAVGINTIVGSGIFRLPAELARDLGVLAPLAFLGCALLLFPVALCFAEAGGRFEGGGGVYLYAREAFGRHVGSAIGVSTFAATVLTLATVAVAVPGQMAELLPDAASPGAGRAISTCVIAALGILNLVGVRPSALTTNAFALLKMVPLVLFCAVGVFFVDLGNGSRLPSASGVSVGGPLLVAFFALSGFETVAVPAGEAASPRAHVPWAVLFAIAGAAVLYVVIQTVALGVSAPEAIAVSERPLADAARVFLGEPGAKGMAIVGAVSMLGLCAAMAFVAPRFLEALSLDQLLPAVFARRHPTFQTPHVAVVGSTVISVALSILFDFETLLDFTSVLLIVQYVATCAAVLVFKVRGAPVGSFRLPWIVPVVGIGFLLWAMLQLGWLEIGVALGVLVLGALPAILARKTAVA